MIYTSGSATEVQELMTPSVVTMRSNQTVHDALTAMSEENISALPIIDEDGLFVGIVSITDFLRVVLATDDILENDYPHYEDCLWAVDLIQQRLGTDKVTTLMTEIVATVSPEKSMHNAACILLNNHLHHLPVVNSTGELVGMLSSSDFVRLAAGTKPR